jgi:hypothetical protein
VTLSTTFEALAAQAPKYLPKGAAIVAYAEALKEPAGGVEPALEKAKALVQTANPSGTDPELKEIATLIDKALSVY